MIVYLTEMSEMPTSCKDCDMEDCRLPLRARRYEPTIKKCYTSQRHPDCPLREITIEV